MATVDVDPSFLLLGCKNEAALVGGEASELDIVPGVGFDEQQLSSLLDYDGTFDDGDAFDEADLDWLPPPETPPAKSKEVRLQWNDTRSFIRSMVEEMDWRSLSIRDAHHLLKTMFIKGGGDPNDHNISFATVQRIVNEVREEASKEREKQSTPDRLVVHFDGVIVTLGAKQGARRVEHLAVTVTGSGEEIPLGIFETSSGKGCCCCYCCCCCCCC